MKMLGMYLPLLSRKIRQGDLPCALCLQTLNLRLNLVEALFYSSEFRKYIDNHYKPGGVIVVIAAFDALNRKIDSIAKVRYFLITTCALIENS